MGNDQKPEVDEEELKKAQAFWHDFTEYSKYAIIAVCLGLITLAVTLI